MPSPSPLSSLNNTILSTGKLTTIKVPSEKVLIGDEESTQPFNPSQKNITAGNTIMWINSDIEVHTVTSGSPDNKISNTKVFDSGNLNPKQTFEHTFNKAGYYKYFCKLHPSMVGVVEVK
jgi:plastocyanin